jgi:hypothetical protein
MADEVKWVPLSQSNREMEFSTWMEYLIKIVCAVYQIDPAEINFDISKTNTSTLNESSNEARLKSSRDKGLKPLLDYLQGLINDHILPRWNKELSKKYKFKFVGLDAESRQQEGDRLEKETKVWKTLNEARREQGREPLEDGDVVLNAVATQYKQMKLANQAEQQGAMGDEGAPMDSGMDEEDQSELDNDLDGLVDEIDAVLGEPDAKSEEKEETKKSKVIEYHYIKDDEE